MEPSLEGLLTCGALLALGWRLGSPLLVALFASLPLSSTAFATLSALGGSTPLVYTLLALVLIVATASRPSFARDLGILFRSEPTAWIVLGLLFYAIAGATILPRLFAGETSAFVVFRGGILELPLAPTTGNITQTAYFALGAMTYYALALRLTDQAAVQSLRLALFGYVAVYLATGSIDLGAKIAGLGDVLMPIRTANYSLLTEIASGGFWRVVGATPEASAYAIGIVSCLAFTATYWRTTGSRTALLLSILCLLLCLLSTSTTAYGALAILALLQALLSFRHLLSLRAARRDLAVAACVPVAIVAVLAIEVAEDKALEPVTQLIETSIIKKAQSDSGKEREYWNKRSLATLGDTYGLGTGFGSSRSSSWIIAVLSQLGVVGAVLMALLLASLMRGPGPARSHDRRDLALYRGARASALAFLIGASLSGGSADPGILFFLCLAVVTAARRQAASLRLPTAARSDLSIAAPYRPAGAR